MRLTCPLTGDTGYEETTIAVLRLLGRLEVVHTPILQALLFHQVSRRTMYTRLEELRTQRLIWTERVSWYRTPRSGRQRGVRPPPPPKQPQVWGLTQRGRDVLGDMGAEPDERSLAALKIRDLRQKPLSALTIAHDLLAAWWCAAILVPVRDNTLVRSIFCQVEFVSHARQRMDALMVLRLRREGSVRSATEVGTIPWFDGSDRHPDEPEIRLALEIDRGTEQLTTLLDKSICYRDLHKDGTYARTLGGPVMPVFVVPTWRRAGQIASEWQHGWHRGWGLIATTTSADHAEDGPLWGEYKSLREGDQGQRMPVLTRLVVNALGEVSFVPAVTQAVWKAHHVPPVHLETTEEER